MEPQKEQKNVEQIDTDENCRLRHGLNPNCLTEIFQYLDSADLIRLSNMNDYYKSIILEYVIAKKFIVFKQSNLRGAYENIFQNFGKKIKKIHFTGDPRRLQYLLQNTIQHCAVGQLKEVIFNMNCYFNMRCSCEHFGNLITPQLISEAIPYFSNVHLVWLCNDHWGSDLVWQIPLTLFSQSTNIQTLKLEKVLMNDAQLRWDQLENLHDITLIKMHDFNQSTFIAYLKRRPKLKRFTWKGEQNIVNIGEALATYCGDTICSFHHYDTRHSTSVDIRTRYEFLSKFQNLAHLTISSVIKCGSDLYYPLEKLAQKNMLKSLEIYQYFVERELPHIEPPHIEPSVSAKKALVQQNIGEFKHLKHLTLNIDISCSIEKDPQHLQFILDRSEHIFQNVHTLVLSGNRSDKTISKIIGLLPNLRQLCAVDLTINNLLLGTRKLVTAIRKLVESRRIADDELKPKDFIDVIAEGMVWREFAAYENKYINLVNPGTAKEVKDFAIQGTIKVPEFEF